MKRFRWLILTLLGAMPGLAMAADIDGTALPLWWDMPFAGILLSIAIMPLQRCEDA